jgi:hypothetical protein
VILLFWNFGILLPVFCVLFNLILGNTLVCDTGNHKIRKIDVHGIVSTIAGSTKGYADGIGTKAKFSWPSGICVNDEGTIMKL